MLRVLWESVSILNEPEESKIYIRNTLYPIGIFNEAEREGITVQLTAPDFDESCFIVSELLQREEVVGKVCVDVRPLLKSRFVKKEYVFLSIKGAEVGRGLVTLGLASLSQGYTSSMAGSSQGGLSICSGDASQDDLYERNSELGSSIYSNSGDEGGSQVTDASLLCGDMNSSEDSNDDDISNNDDMCVGKRSSEMIDASQDDVVEQSGSNLGSCDDSNDDDMSLLVAADTDINADADVSEENIKTDFDENCLKEEIQERIHEDVYDTDNSSEASMDDLLETEEVVEVDISDAQASEEMIFEEIAVGLDSNNNKPDSADLVQVTNQEVAVIEETIDSTNTEIFPITEVKIEEIPASVIEIEETLEIPAPRFAEKDILEINDMLETSNDSRIEEDGEYGQEEFDIYENASPKPSIRYVKPFASHTNTTYFEAYNINFDKPVSRVNDALFLNCNNREENSRAKVNLRTKNIAPSRNKKDGKLPKINKSKPRKKFEDQRSSFIMRMDQLSESRERNRKLQAAKEEYNASLGKKCCPNCHKDQSFDQIQKRQKKCPDCRVQYRYPLIWNQVRDEFLDRQQKSISNTTNTGKPPVAPAGSKNLSSAFLQRMEETSERRRKRNENTRNTPGYNRASLGGAMNYSLHTTGKASILPVFVEPHAPPMFEPSQMTSQHDMNQQSKMWNARRVVCEHLFPNISD